ncbi:hypothetical protein Tco_0444989 [Tanacetum coccineum]
MDNLAKGRHLLLNVVKLGTGVGTCPVFLTGVDENEEAYLGELALQGLGEVGMLKYQALVSVQWACSSCSREAIGNFHFELP